MKLHYNCGCTIEPDADVTLEDCPIHKPSIMQETTPAFDLTCDLCDLVKGNIITRLYHKDDVCVVVDCVTCSTPMIVLSRHTILPTIAELKHMAEILSDLFGDKAALRIEQRRIRDHLHFHVQ